MYTGLRKTLLTVVLSNVVIQHSNATKCAAGTWSADGNKCPSGWSENSGASSCLRYDKNDQRSWHNAKAACESWGGYLPAPSDSSGLIAIDNYRRAVDGMNGDGWDTWGAIYRNSWDCYTWYDTTGKVQTYFNWNGGEPKWGGCSELCGQFRDSRGWNDEDCRRTFSFVCQRPFVCAACTISACSGSVGQYRETCQLGATANAGCVPCTNAPECSGSSAPPTYTSSGSPSRSNNCAWEAPPGSFRQVGPSSGDTCSVCSPGKFSATSGLSECSLCASGKYQAGKGSIVCDACPSNSNAPEASDERRDCKCNTGWTGPDGEHCTQCEAGKYKIASGDAACSECSAGQYSTAVGATSDVCQGCPSNSNAPEASDEEVDCTCNAGSSGADGQNCTQCEAGKYKIEAGNSACTNCVAGKYSKSIGATSNACRGCP